MRAVVLVIGMFTSTASADTLRGRVWTGDEPAARAAVLLEGDGGEAVLAPVDGVWLSFVPKVQIVAPGSTLLLRDRDDESHTVHAWFGGETLFNVATVPRGEEQRARLTRLGVVTLSCDLHQEMRAYVLVTPSRHHAVTDLEGNFTIEAPRGRYRARVWRPGVEPASVGSAPGRDVGEIVVDGTPAEIQMPPVEMAERTWPATQSAHTRARHVRAELPSWMRALRAVPTWPTGPWVWVATALGVPFGVLVSVANLRHAARRGRSRLVGLLGGCALAFGAGALVVVGLHGAVATAIGFGAFIGTAIFGALDHRAPS